MVSCVVRLFSVYFNSDNTYQAVFFPMIEPVAGPPGPNDPLQLVGLHPNQFVDAVIAPKLEALAPELHGSVDGTTKFHWSIGHAWV